MIYFQDTNQTTTLSEQRRVACIPFNRAVTDHKPEPLYEIRGVCQVRCEKLKLYTLLI